MEYFLVYWICVFLFQCYLIVSMYLSDNINLFECLLSMAFNAVFGPVFFPILLFAADEKVGPCVIIKVYN